MSLPVSKCQMFIDSFSRAILRVRTGRSIACSILPFVLILIACMKVMPCLADTSNLSDKSKLADGQSLRQKQELLRSKEIIRAQQEAATNQVARQANEDVAARNWEVQQEMNTLSRRHEKEIAEMRNARTYYYDKHGAAYAVPVYRPAQIDAAWQDMQFSEQQFASQDHGLATITANAEHRSGELETDATNLQSQLELDEGNHGFKLSPVGTNLYVRNYQVGASGADDLMDNRFNNQPRSARTGTLNARNGQNPLASILQPGSLPPVPMKPSAGITERVAGQSGRVIQETVTGRIIKL